MIKEKLWKGAMNLRHRSFAGKCFAVLADNRNSSQWKDFSALAVGAISNSKSFGQAVNEIILSISHNHCGSSAPRHVEILGAMESLVLGFTMKEFGILLGNITWKNDPQAVSCFYILSDDCSEWIRKSRRFYCPGDYLIRTGRTLLGITKEFKDNGVCLLGFFQNGQDPIYQAWNPIEQTWTTANDPVWKNLPAFPKEPV